MVNWNNNNTFLFQYSRFSLLCGRKCVTGNVPEWLQRQTPVPSGQKKNVTKYCHQYFCFPVWVFKNRQTWRQQEWNSDFCSSCNFRRLKKMIHWLANKHYSTTPLMVFLCSHVQIKTHQVTSDFSDRTSTEMPESKSTISSTRMFDLPTCGCSVRESLVSQNQHQGWRKWLQQHETKHFKWEVMLEISGTKHIKVIETQEHIKGNNLLG